MGVVPPGPAALAHGGSTRPQPLKEIVGQNMITLENVLAEATKDGRVCPLPRKWNEFWKMLPGKRREGLGWEPPLPLILAAWHGTGLLAKITRFHDHIRWADQHGVLQSAYDYVLGLDEDDWYYGD